MESTFFSRNPWIKDGLGLIVFIFAVVVGTILINSFVFRSFSVEGQSMEPTMYTGDRLIVNRLPITWAQLQNKPYTPERGQIIVFKNPQYTIGTAEEYIVKRVIAFAGERVVLKDGKYTVYSAERPAGFNPDDTNNGEPGSPTSGEFDGTVPSGSLFVSGDHRQGGFSLDSRNGLGYIPLYDVVGPVTMRLLPVTGIRLF